MLFTFKYEHKQLNSMAYAHWSCRIAVEQKSEIILFRIYYGPFISKIMYPLNENFSKN